MRRVALVLLVLAAACGGGERPAEKAPKPVVVTSTQPLTGLVRTLAGSTVDVRQIVPDGADPRTHRLTDADGKTIRGADLVIVSGLGLDRSVETAARASVRKRVVVRALLERALDPRQWIYDASFPREGGDPNPYLWMNTEYALRYSIVIRDELRLLKGLRSASIDANYRRLQTKLAKLDEQARTALGAIPQAKRKLLVLDSSMAYFGPRYGLAVVELPRPANPLHPTMKEKSAIVLKVRAEGNLPVFASADQPAATVIRVELAGPDYISFMTTNVRTIAAALGGSMEVFDT